jgi:serine/threonine-protein kinase
MALEPGQIIDAKYRVVRRIGEGGMGTVYEGENSRIGRRVAIKVLHAQVAAMPEFVERFEREARAAARIGSPHVCDVLDLGDLPNGDRYIVMEYLDGVSFEDRITDRGKLTPAQLAPIAFELLEGLGTMHNARVIHRDLKPANVFLARTAGGRGEMVKILDFGVAKLLPFAGEVGTMTQTGTMMGTPLYMSPEQARGARDVDGRTDIYAASVMFYRALAGVLPYNADTLNELLFKIVLEDPRPLREVAPEVDETFAGIIHKGLAREVTERFQTARAYQEAIAAWGKAQGRSSLSFAVTIPSEPPPRTPITLSEPTAQTGEQIAVAVTGANAGTPIAWSEDGPHNRPSQSNATVMEATGSKAGSSASTTSSSGPARSSASGAGGARGSTDKLSSSAPSGSTMASASNPELPAAQPSDAGIASATTAPVSVGDATGLAAKATAAPTGTTTASRSTEKRSPRNLILGIVGAGAVAVIGIVAFGRGEKPTPAGMTPTPATAPATAEIVASEPNGGKGPALKEIAPAPATANPSLPTDASASAPPSAESATVSSSPSAPTAGRRDTGGAAAPGTVRKIDPAKTGMPGSNATGATPSSAPSAPATAATPPPTAKPAASARKFRTNLD